MKQIERQRRTKMMKMIETNKRCICAQCPVQLHKQRPLETNQKIRSREPDGTGWSEAVVTSWLTSRLRAPRKQKNASRLLRRLEMLYIAFFCAPPVDVCFSAVPFPFLVLSFIPLFWASITLHPPSFSTFSSFPSLLRLDSVSFPLRCYFAMGIQYGSAR